VTDPFDALRAPVTPATPDPAFAARLRARLERALDLPRGVAVTGTATLTETRPSTPAPAGAAIPYLAVRGARRALDWYAEVFDAERVGEPIVMPDGRVGHAELSLSGGALYLAEEHPEIGVVAPAQDAAAVSLVLAVPDVDATLARARGAGGRVTREPYEGYGSRNATVVDPFGHRWMLQTPLAPAPAPAPETARPRHGDIGYASLWVPDAARAARFYADVLGWTYRPEQEGRSRRVHAGTPALGIWADDASTLFCCYAVEDVPAALQRVRDAGGEADEPTREPYGLVAMCTDDQGVRFAVYEPPGGVADADAPGSSGPSEVSQGDLVYVTYDLGDSARTRAFYSTVLGWRFTPGHVEDGWNVEGVRPMAGLHGGQARTTAVPMWAVDDVEAAVRRVREAGGTATAPERQPYGVTSECTDDQGVRFYLGQF